MRHTGPAPLRKGIQAAVRAQIGKRWTVARFKIHRLAAIGFDLLDQSAQFGRSSLRGIGEIDFAPLRL